MCTHIANLLSTIYYTNLLYILYIYCIFKYLCFIILLCRFLFVSLHRISLSKYLKKYQSHLKQAKK